VKNLNYIVSAGGVIKEINWCCGAKRVSVKTKDTKMKGPTIFREYSRGSNRCFFLITTGYFCIIMCSIVVAILGMPFKVLFSYVPLQNIYIFQG